MSRMIHPRHFYYILDKMKNVVECGVDEVEFLLKDKDKKIVKQEEYNDKFISTVFLGIDHYMGPDKDHPPVVFETMVFDKSESPRGDIYQERYCTWKEAEEGHARAVQWVREGCLDEDATID